MNDKEHMDAFRRMIENLIDDQKLFKTATVIGPPKTRGNYRQHLEAHPSIITSVTDADMLRLHIDMALDDGDNKLFMQLTEQLKEVEVNG